MVVATDQVASDKVDPHLIESMQLSLRAFRRPPVINSSVELDFFVTNTIEQGVKITAKSLTSMSELSLTS